MMKIDPEAFARGVDDVLTLRPLRKALRVQWGRIRWRRD